MAAKIRVGVTADAVREDTKWTFIDSAALAAKTEIMTSSAILTV
jgi:hypothetical protein